MVLDSHCPPKCKFADTCHQPLSNRESICYITWAWVDMYAKLWRLIYWILKISLNDFRKFCSSTLHKIWGWTFPCIQLPWLQSRHLKTWLYIDNKCKYSTEAFKIQKTKLKFQHIHGFIWSLYCIQHNFLSHNHLCFVLF